MSQHLALGSEGGRVPIATIAHETAECAAWELGQSARVMLHRSALAAVGCLRAGKAHLREVKAWKLGGCAL